MVRRWVGWVCVSMWREVLLGRLIQIRAENDVFQTGLVVLVWLFSTTVAAKEQFSVSDKILTVATLLGAFFLGSFLFLEHLVLRYLVLN